jgi:hypothetical protein
VRRWARGKNLRQMLAALPEVWKDAPKEDFGKHVANRKEFDGNKLKKAYLKAVRLVHPDKIAMDAPVKHRVLAQKVFGRLNEAHSEKHWDR